MLYNPRFLSAIAIIKLLYYILSYSWRWWYMLWDSSKWGYLWQWKVLLGSSWGICNGQTFRKSNVRRKRFSGNERKDWEISENISWNMELLLESYDWSQVRSMVQDKVKNWIHIRNGISHKNSSIMVALILVFSFLISTL